MYVLVYVLHMYICTYVYAYAYAFAYVYALGPPLCIPYGAPPKDVIYVAKQTSSAFPCEISVRFPVAALDRAMVALPTVPVVLAAAAASRVLKNGEAFTPVRSTGLGWETVYKAFHENSTLAVGDVRKVPLRDLHGGNLKLRTGARCETVTAVDVGLTPAMQAFLVSDVKEDSANLCDVKFWVTGVDKKKSLGRNAGSHDLIGCFPRGQPVCGKCGAEHKYHFGSAGYEAALKEHKDKLELAFLAQASGPHRVAAQLLLMTQVSGTGKPKRLRSDLLLYTAASGWTALRPTGAPGSTAAGAWSSCATTTLQRDGEEVRVLHEVYNHLGFCTKNMGQDVHAWTRRSSGLGLKKHNFKQKRVKVGRGNCWRYTVSFATLKKAWPRLAARLAKEKRKARP